MPKVKKVFIRSGIRYDYMLADKSPDFFRKLVRDHVSGQLKVAPEHICDSVLRLMGKPSVDKYEEFRRKYFKYSKECGKEQYIVPYLMSSHPGSTLNDAVELALYLRRNGVRPEQVQDFYPTPGTVSTVMYYTGIDPLTGKNVYCTDDYREKLMQRALLQYNRKENAPLIREALVKCGREELIGSGKDCLVGYGRQESTGHRQVAGRPPHKAGAKKVAESHSGAGTREKNGGSDRKPKERRGKQDKSGQQQKE